MPTLTFILISLETLCTYTREDTVYIVPGTTGYHYPLPLCHYVSVKALIRKRVVLVLNLYRPQQFQRLLGLVDFPCCKL